ncbi:MAG: class I SAM-dependent methyltransferase [Candidatus Eremiobacteraeota bacterium]|nr:class I SAM-dependent methyltransferase [Candidatus Eremiobacteraeota bacterium]
MTTSRTSERPASPWSLGDFHVIGAGLLLVGERLCDDIDLCAGKSVLDVACGSGNTALAAARRGCSVTGLDLVDSLTERARLRSQAEGYSITYLVGNAEQLPFEDAAFDVVLSTFGVMFAPDQERAANELMRVCRPRGTIAMANWTPESLPGELFKVSSAYMPPPPGVKPAIEWGTVPGLQRLFGGRVSNMRLIDHSVRQRFVSIDAWVDTFRKYFGPVRNAFETLDAERRQTYEADLRKSVSKYNRATDGTLSVSMAYVNVSMQSG